MRILGLLSRLGRKLRPEPPPPAPVRHQLAPEFEDMRKAIYHVWDHHEEAESLVMVMDTGDGFHVHMVGAGRPVAKSRLLHALNVATSTLMTAKGGSHE